MTGTVPRLLALFVAAVLMMPAVTAGAEVLLVGVHRDNKPWVFDDASGKRVGIEVDMMTAMSSQLGTDIALVPMEFPDLFNAVASGEVDAAVSSISITPDRQRRFDFTQPYYVTSQAVVALKTSGIKRFADLSGQTVAAMPASTNSEWLEANKARYGIRSVRLVDNMTEALALLRAQEVAAYFGDQPALLYELLSSRDLSVIARLPTNDRYAILLRKNSPLSDRFNDALSRVKTSGDMEWIHRKWFGSKPAAGSPTVTVMPRP